MPIALIWRARYASLAIFVGASFLRKHFMALTGQEETDMWKKFILLVVLFLPGCGGLKQFFNCQYSWTATTCVNSVQESGKPIEQDPAQSSGANSDNAAISNEKIRQMAELMRLRDQGVITPQEFETQRQKLIRQ